jgi:alkylation response protein AidB-like acyl-CoA dehydrogenase
MMGGRADAGAKGRSAGGGSNFPWQQMAGDQSAIRSVITRLGRERFQPRMARYDLEASFPFENYEDMRREGLLALTVPERYGGLGSDYRAYAHHSVEMGRWCGATALTFNMHACTPIWTGHIADDLEMTAAQRKEHEANRALQFRRIVEGGALFAQPFSEGSAAAAGKAPFGTLATRTDGGWVLNGKKIFASLSGAADYYGVLCTEDKADRSVADTLFVAVPKDAPGLEIVGPWDPVGMRATVSRTLLLENVFVPDENMLMPRGVYYQAARRWPHMFLTLCPTYLGIAHAAYDFTVRYLRGEVEGVGVKRRMYPTKQVAVAEMYIKLQAAQATFNQVIDEARVDPPKHVRLRAYAAQYTVMETSNEICRLAIRTCGGQAMLKSLPLEQYYRDSRLGSLMLPWTAELCVDRLGRETLYEPGETDE